MLPAQTTRCGMRASPRVRAARSFMTSVSLIISSSLFAAVLAPRHQTERRGVDGALACMARSSPLLRADGRNDA